jgi:RNA polymerase sigma factor (sigma-70 family)
LGLRAAAGNGFSPPFVAAGRSHRALRPYDPDVVLWARRIDQLSDEAVLAALAVDDRDAAAVLVRRYQRRVYGLAVSIVGDPVLAEDVAQQAFERAWRHAASYDPRRATVATWLLTIARHLAIDAVRSRRSEPVDPQVLLGRLPAAGDPDPADAAEHRAAVDEVTARLAELPDEQRRAVVLAALAGRTAAEISATEQIPLGTAKTRLRLGLAKLRTALTPLGGDGD